MDFSEVVLKRRMVRHFTSEPVDLAIIKRIVDLARHAPSAGFTQGQSFVVVTQPELKEKIARLCGEESYVESGFHPFISEAPVLIIPCTSEAAYHQRYQEADKVDEEGNEIIWPVPYWHMDIGCAIMILLLGVVNERSGGWLCRVAQFRRLYGLARDPGHSHRSYSRWRDPHRSSRSGQVLRLA